LQSGLLVLHDTCTDIAAGGRILRLDTWIDHLSRPGISGFADLSQKKGRLQKEQQLIYRKPGGQVPDKMTPIVKENPMKTDLQADRFKALDACHQQMHAHLAVLAELLEQLESDGSAALERQKVQAAEAFYSETARAHHEEEERSVFPNLLLSNDADLVHAVQTLKQDHGWIEENWRELSPMLRAISLGEDWVDMDELRHTIAVFLTLCHDHIVLEETLIYPQAKARLAQELASRALRLAQ